MFTTLAPRGRRQTGLVSRCTPALTLALLCAASACTGIDDRQIYSHGADHPLLCGLDIDGDATDADDLLPGLDHAVAEGSIVHLYGHKPGATVSIDRIEALLAAAAVRHVPVVTYADLLDGVDGPGLALSFDDAHIDAWHQLRPLFDRYGVRVTFFVTRFHRLGPALRAELHELAADGHDIEYHSANHKLAVDYVADHGMAAYLADEIDSDLQLMIDDGFAPTVFAYPYGQRSRELDSALLTRFALLRGIASRCDR